MHHLSSTYFAGMALHTLNCRVSKSWYC